MKSFYQTKKIESSAVIPQVIRSRRLPDAKLKTRPSRAENSCDQANKKSTPLPPTRQTVISGHLFKFLIVLISPAIIGVVTSVVAASAAASSSSNEFQLVARAGGRARLPCLIGKQSLCGEPYFIAWYKLNSTSRQWSRVEARRLTAGDEFAAHSPHERIKFVMPENGMPALSSCAPQLDNNNNNNNTNGRGGGQQLSYSNNRQLLAGQKSLASRSFDCGQLTIGELDLIDEGQYKCEITFSDSLDFDSCPASTTTQLNVIARPNEPEILLNGKPLAVGQQTSGGSGATNLTFKEGAQVRLECQSTGGKPAPRIEWLNLTSVAWAREIDHDDQSMMIGQQHHEWRPRQPIDRAQVQIMRSYWPIKRASYSIPASNGIGGGAGSGEPTASNNINQAATSQGQRGVQIPVTSSSITITLSRFDMRSRFVCLVVPAQWEQVQSQQSNGKSYAQKTDEMMQDKNWIGMPEIARNPAHLAELLDRTQMLEAPVQRADDTPPLVKWIKFDILAKPTSVSMRVLDLTTRSLVQPAQQQQQQSTSSLVSLFANQLEQPIYSLHPNRAYAIQCLVEESRPRSQVAWFNRTAPVVLVQRELPSSGPDYLIGATRNLTSHHRLSSFVHYAQQESAGTFRTTASLVLTTSLHDNLDEFFCRVSNEAFQFDELAQVAPIISVRLHVNYPPTSWLESPEVKWPTDGQMGRLTSQLGQRVQIRCLVGANPLTQSAILSIDWLKDGRRIAATGSTFSSNSSQQNGRLTLEKTNHLHTPLTSQTPQLDLANRISASSIDQQQLAAQASRLLAASTLTLSSLSKSDAGQYSCQFRLIPMHPQQQQVAGRISAGSLLTAGANLSPFQQQQQQQQMKSITGQANQSIQLNVIEEKLPLVQVASTSGLFVYDKLTPVIGLPGIPNSKLDRQNLAVVVISRRAKITLRCDLDSPSSQEGGPSEMGHKVLWQLNGAFLHSNKSDQLEIDLAAAAAAASAESGQTNDENSELAGRLLAGNGGRLTCAHQLLEQSSLQALDFNSQAMRTLASSNELDLRFKVEPKLMQASRHEMLMPAVRTFSELELIAQPLSRLRLVCLAQCEPLCSIDWFANGRPVHELHSQTGGDFHDTASQSAWVHMREMADNQTQIFKSTRRLGGALLELENQIHRRTLTSAERFPWYKQTSLVSSQLELPSEPVAGQMELASRQLMRDSYELIQSSGLEAMGSNVFSKLELSYNQLSQMLSLVSLAHQSEELQLECKLNELLDGAGDKQQGAQPEGAAHFGHALVRTNTFYPAQVNETDEFEGARQLKNGPLNLTSLFEDQHEQEETSQPKIDRILTRVVLEKTQQSVPSAFARGNLLPILLNSQLSPPANSSQPESRRQLDNLQAPGGPTTSPIIKNWLAQHLDLALIVACSLALIWLLSLFVSPLMRRRFFARSPSSTANMLKQKRENTQHWPRFNQPGSRASSTNEIGLLGGSGGGGGGSMHKFNLGAIQSAPNYYGAPDSAGGDSSELDMVQSSSQSSHYEDFIQHQFVQQQRLAAAAAAAAAAHQQQQQHQVAVQPLYFNQAHLIESTTLSRRSLMKSSYSSSSTGGDTSGGSGGGGSRAPLTGSRIYGDIRQQQQQQHPMPSFASTMRRHTSSQQSQVQPLISGATCNSSRINFSDLHKHRHELPSGSQTFGKKPLLVPVGLHPLERMQEHIYDDVN